MSYIKLATNLFIVKANSLTNHCFKLNTNLKMLDYVEFFEQDLQ